MGKTYLRYVPSGVYGVIASAATPFAVEPSGQLVFTAQLENVGVWHIKRGVQVRCRPAQCRTVRLPLSHAALLTVSEAREDPCRLCRPLPAPP